MTSSGVCVKKPFGAGARRFVTLLALAVSTNWEHLLSGVIKC